VPADLADALRAQAHSQERSLSAELRRAIRAHLENSDARPRTVAPRRAIAAPDMKQGSLTASRPRTADSRAARRQPLIATLVLAGLRIGEALDLRWRDVDLAAGHLNVADAKTPAGVRKVDLSPALRELLTEY
jgi:integrase